MDLPSPPRLEPKPQRIPIKMEKALELILHDGSRRGRELRRAMALVLSENGWTTPEIAEVIGQSPRTVRRLIRRSPAPSPVTMAPSSTGR